MPYRPERHGPVRVVGPGFHARVHAIVRAVPRGRVTTYGDVGRALGLTTIARHVGYALSALPKDCADVPWYRVVNGRGRVSARPNARRQCALLRREGVVVDAEGKIADFARRRVVPRRHA
jgi:methylated-DNA-protein-cysteine methyltransferase-like protein